MKNYNEYKANLILYCKKYINKSTDEICNEFNIKSTAKSINYVIAKNIAESFMGKDLFKSLLDIENINLKTVQLNEQEMPKESMSFSPIDYMQLVKEDWENSTFRKYLSREFIFFIFKKENNKNILKKIFLWTMPIEDLDGEAKLVWNTVKLHLIQGTIIKSQAGGVERTNFPAQKDTYICHVRPHGANGYDMNELPVADKMTGYKYMKKMSFWFNRNYIKKIYDMN